MFGCDASARALLLRRCRLFLVVVMMLVVVFSDSTLLSSICGSRGRTRPCRRLASLGRRLAPNIRGKNRAYNNPYTKTEHIHLPITERNYAHQNKPFASGNLPQYSGPVDEDGSTCIAKEEHSFMLNIKDQDREKGAVEQDERTQTGNTSMQGQLGHRDQDPMLKAADSDFPEPGENPEHSGGAHVINEHDFDEVA